MSDQEINIAIAEACGWKFEQTEEGGKITYPCGFACKFFPISWAEEKFLKTIPNYCEDLNAMNEAENWMIANKSLMNFWKYADNLKRHFSNLGDDGCIHATARQRAEAFLLAIGKLEDGAK